MSFHRHSRAVRLTLAIAALPVCPPAAAQVTADSSLKAAGVPVVHGSDTLFTLYGRFGPFGAAERAVAVERRLARLAPALANGLDSILVNEVDQRTELLVGEEVLMTVLDADAAPVGFSRPALAGAWAARIRQVIAAQAEARSLATLTIDAAKALAATLILLALLLGLQSLFRRIYALLRGGGVPPLRVKRLELLSAARLGEALTLLARTVRVVITTLLLYFYVPLVLSFFPWTAPYSGRIIGYILTPLRAIGLGLLDYLPKIFVIAVIVMFTRYLLKVIHLVFRAIGSGTMAVDGFEREWAAPTFNIIRFLVLAFAAVVVFPYLPGAESEAFKGVSLFVGVLLSFGSSGAVGNIVAGVVLTYTNAFRIGDRVQIGETVGDVVERTMLVTRLRTIKNVEVTIPNAAVLSSQIINFAAQAAGRGLILHTTVTIGYDAPWRQVHELLIAAAAATEHVLGEPAPFVLQTSLDDFFVSYEINAYTDQPAVMAATYSLLHQNIQDRFNQAGVEIMSPHYRSLRDGNTVTTPEAMRPKGYRAPGIRVEQVRPDDPASTNS